MLAPDAMNPLFAALLAYGPAPGVELIPYFLGLLAWIGLALSAFLLAPVTALLRRLRRGRSKPDAIEAANPQSPDNDNHDQA